MKQMVKFTASTLFITALAVSASATDYSGSDWKFDYQGHYSIVGANVGSSLGLDSLLKGTLLAQLGLLNGNVSSNCPNVAITQSSPTAIKTNDLHFSATYGVGLLTNVNSLVYNLLDANDGQYNGTIAGSTMTLSKNPVLGATVFGLGALDTRVLGLGTVVDLRAALPTNTLVGTVDGIQGGRAYHVTGTAGLMNTIGIEAKATTYFATLSGIKSTSTDYVNVGVIQTTADSWSLSRSPQAVPEPGSMAALGLGIAGIIKRRRKAKAA